MEQTQYSLVSDLWDFIENVTEDDPGRNEKFFALRARVRDYFDTVSSAQRRRN